MGNVLGNISADDQLQLSKTMTVILQVMSSIRDCFVTGKWEDDKDAAKLLEEDGMCNTSKNDSYIRSMTS